MCQRKAHFLTKKESEREWCRQLVELGRAAGENAEKTRTVNDIRADGRPHRRYGYFFQRMNGYMCGTERTNWLNHVSLDGKTQ